MKLAFFKARLVDYSLAFTAVWILVVYSLMAHKEFRFIYPVLPIIMVYAGVAIHSIGTASVEELEEEERLKLEEEPDNEAEVKQQQPKSSSMVATPSDRKRRRRRFVYYSLAFLSFTNAVFGYYLGMFHQRGVMDVMYWLRRQVQQQSSGSGNNYDIEKTLPWLAGIIDVSQMLSPSKFMNKDEGQAAVAVGVDGILFLMPCHSTPFQCILHNPNIPMRFLTCEPPFR